VILAFINLIDNTKCYKVLESFESMEIRKVCEIKKSGQRYITIPKNSKLYDEKYVKVEEVQE